MLDRGLFFCRKSLPKVGIFVFPQTCYNRFMLSELDQKSLDNAKNFLGSDEVNRTPIGTTEG